VVIDFVHVHTLAEVRICGVGCAEINGLCICQCTVAALAGASTSDDADLKGTASSMLGFGLLSYFCRSALGSTSRGKSAQTDGLTILDESGSLCGCDFVEFDVMLIFICLFF
jgi:hypothetical protein